MSRDVNKMKCFVIEILCELNDLYKEFGVELGV